MRLPIHLEEIEVDELRPLYKMMWYQIADGDLPIVSYKQSTSETV